MQNHAKPFHFSSDSSCDMRLLLKMLFLKFGFAFTLLPSVATVTCAGNEDDGER